MDPEQLARAADQADEALAAQTNDYALQAAIAERRPDLWAALASNPSSYPDLLVWLSKLSDPAVRAELEARGAVLQGTTVARADAESQDPEASREEDDSHGGGTTQSGAPQEAAHESSAEGTETAEMSEAQEPDEPHGGSAFRTVEAASQDDGAAHDEPAGVQAEREDAESPVGAGESRAEDAVPQDEAGSQDEAASQDEAGPQDDGAAHDEPAGVQAGQEDAEPPVEGEESRAEDAGSQDEVGSQDDGAAHDEPAGVQAGQEDAEPPVGAEESRAEDAASQDEAGSQDDGAAHDEPAGAQGIVEPRAEGAEEAEGAASSSSDRLQTQTMPSAPSAPSATSTAAASPGAGTESQSEAASTASAASTAPAAGTSMMPSMPLAPSAASAPVPAGPAGPSVGGAPQVGPVPPMGATPPAVPPTVPSAGTAPWAVSGSGVPLVPVQGQMIEPGPEQPRRSRSRAPVAVLVALVLLIVGGVGGWYVTSYLNDRDSTSVNGSDRADRDKPRYGKQDASASAEPTSTGATNYVTACGSAPVFTPTSVRNGDGELQVEVKVTASCPSGDVLGGTGDHVELRGPSRSDGTGPADAVVASGDFDFSGSPLVISGSGTTLTLHFGSGHFYRTADDMDLTTIVVTCAPDRGSAPTAATPGASSPSSATAATTSKDNTLEETAAKDSLRWQADHDKSSVKGVSGKWVPQLSSKKSGMVADGITWDNRATLQEFLKLRQKYSDAKLLYSDEWPVFDSGGQYWVTIVATPYGSADEANAWCSAEGFDGEHCFAKYIDTKGSSEGTTVNR